MFFVGGLLPYLLYESSRADMLACEHCGLVFKARVRTDWRPIFALLGTLTAIVTVIFLVVYLTS